ncbi:hypothetical protein HQ36_05435 [Porphyromonas gingivicanis]|uniref:Uncharacterized protein n=1 Tax=Porphyromonas gingivicanis TaxID=266762 RepID=A0A0A2G5R6_9PORP|nr:hypothetical protein [Porphyromonas gingivicanis]KGN97715.1 hypothetical protein HQ36_05435 [Porphyromonas gingivicanis]
MEKKGYKGNWEATREKLLERKKEGKEIYHYEGEVEVFWKKAINDFRERLEKYFFEPIDSIIKKEGTEVAILTLQCTLIEMFASFKEGKVYDENFDPTNSNPSSLDWCKFSSSKSVFTEFLKNHESLKTVFQGPKITVEKFYEEVRCALMHEARLKGTWQTIENKLPPAENKFIFTEKNPNHNTTNEKINISTSILHQELKKHLDDYIGTLKRENPSNKEDGKKRKFARCMDHLFEINIDPNDLPDWWVEVS